ncbi:MAG: DUF2093 domain-containing protein [Candidatus Marinimicrobia bacterium]|nr:DUF2093 domain-containing protein [Candidatus Neomarinimicrobiota bacterium]|tara:strand:- start:11569 stop:11763 length:195 start_codon:yes stop_codon:yes gene_type:complete
MNRIKAKLKFYPNRFEVVKEGDHVICAVSGKSIPLNKLNYWNVELQEPYYSPTEVMIRHKKSKL